MKYKTSLAFFVSIYTLCISSIVFSKDFTVTKQLRSKPVYISDLGLSLDSSEVGHDSEGNQQALGSKIAFTMSGQYSSGWCWIDDLFIQIERDESQDWAAESGTLQFVGTDAKSTGQILDLSSKACAGGSSGRFTVPFSLRLNVGKSSHSWTYIINSETLTPERQVTKKLTINFELETGWSYSFE